MSMGYRAREPWPASLKFSFGLLMVLALSAFTWTLQPGRVRRTDDASLPSVSSRPEPAAGLTGGEPVAATTTRETQDSPVPPAPKRPSRSPLDDFRRAVRYHEAGDLNKAVEIYHSLLARDALPAEVRNNLGLIHQARGDLAEGARELRNALKHNPNYAKAHNNLGVLLLAQQRIEAAMASFRAAAAADPADIDPIINLGLAQKAAGLPEQAAETLLSALGVSPHSAPAHYNLAVLYDGSGERARAVEHYRAFLEHRGSAHASMATDVEARLAALDGAR